MPHPRFPVAVHILLRRDDEVLLVRRCNTGYEDGKLSVVAGHVEPGETVTRAEKCSELVWAKRSALPPDTIPYVRAAIERFDGRQWFHEFGWE